MLQISDNLSDGFSAALESFIEGITPPPRYVVREWADQRRILPSKGSAEPGRWRTSRTPYLEKIMDCLDPYHPAKRIVFMKSSQVGGTEVGNNWVGWFIDTQRSSMMVVQPTLDMAEKWSKQRLAPMIEATPSLNEKIKPARSRDSGNTTLMKEWPGGLLVVSGANSAASLASMPIGNLLLDEIDRYPFELDGEGDPIKIAEARTTTYRRAKIMLISSPTIESLSRINKEFNASKRHHLHFPCPHCGEKQELKFENLRWPTGRPEEAMYHCEHCGTGVEHSHKTWMLEHSEWVSDDPDSEAWGFHLSGLWAPAGLGLTWGEIAAEYDEVKDDPTRLKVFKNTRLGICEKDPIEKVDYAELMSRAEDYSLRVLPEGCLLVTVGVDVQKDRFAILALGFGRGGQRWYLDWIEIEGDPLKPESWAKLTQYLATPFTTTDGVPVYARSIAIDSGNWQNEVLNYVRNRPVRGLFAVKGASQYGKPIIGKPSKVDLKRNGQVLKHGAEQWQVGHDTAKFDLFARLQSDRAASGHADQLIHFSKELPEYFYTQLTAEVYDPNKRRWVKIRQRNESLDCSNYALAAAYHPNVRAHLMKDTHWDSIEESISKKGKTIDLFASSEPTESTTEPQADHKPIEPPKQAPPKKRRWK